MLPSQDVRSPRAWACRAPTEAGSLQCWRHAREARHLRRIRGSGRGWPRLRPRPRRDLPQGLHAPDRGGKSPGSGRTRRREHYHRELRRRAAAAGALLGEHGAAVGCQEASWVCRVHILQQNRHATADRLEAPWCVVGSLVLSGLSWCMRAPTCQCLGHSGSGTILFATGSARLHISLVAGTACPATGTASQPGAKPCTEPVPSKSRSSRRKTCWGLSTRSRESSRRRSCTLAAMTVC